MNEKKTFGFCECGGSLLPAWFTEEEYATKGGIRWKTGRYRRACSHLECDACHRKVCVYDTFDGPWQTR